MIRRYVDFEGEVKDVYSIDNAPSAAIQELMNVFYDVCYESYLTLPDDKECWEAAKYTTISGFLNSLSDPNYSQKFIKTNNFIFLYNANKMYEDFEINIFEFRNLLK